MDKCRKEVLRMLGFVTWWVSCACLHIFTFALCLRELWEWASR